MLTLGPLAFATPWILGGLVVLPGLWWLLRLTPPAPRTVPFPALMLLRDLVAREETPAKAPFWLLALRLALVALMILGLAGPLWHPEAPLAGSGPLALVVDDGWAAAADWPSRREAANSASRASTCSWTPSINRPFVRTGVRKDKDTGQPVERALRFKKWWSKDGNRYVVVLRYGASALFSEAIIAPTIEDVITVFDGVIEAAKAGDLDPQLGSIKRGKKGAAGKVQRR